MLERKLQGEAVPSREEEEPALEGEASEKDVEIVEEVLPVTIRRRRNNPRKKREPTIEEHYQYLMDLKFEGTRYPHTPTMLETFLTYKFEGYKEGSCQFLAT